MEEVKSKIGVPVRPLLTILKSTETTIAFVNYTLEPRVLFFLLQKKVYDILLPNPPYALLFFAE
jgi:hypothetical protein